MPAFDWSVLLPILTAFIPILLPLFPGLNGILKALPRSFWEMCVKIVAPGSSITWAPSPQSQRAALEARRNVLLAKSYSASFSGDEQAALANVEAQLEAMPRGGIMDVIMSLIGGGGGGGLMPILLIVGVVVLPMIMGDGCKKKPATPATPKAEAPVVIDASRP